MSVTPASPSDQPVVYLMVGAWTRVMGLPAPAKASLIAQLTIANPRRAQQMRYSGLPNEDEPFELTGYQDLGDDLLIAPGYTHVAAGWLRVAGFAVEVFHDRAPAAPLGLVYGGVAEIREYQQSFVKSMLREEFGTGVAPCGAGKTDAAIQVMVARGCRWLIIVEKKDLRDQWIERLTDRCGPGTACVYKPQNKKRWRPEAPFVVATCQALVRHPDDCAKLSAEREGVCVDEVHHAASNQFVSVLTQFDALYRTGFTATPMRGDGTTDLLFWYVGPRMATIERDTVEGAGHLLRPRLEVLETGLAWHGSVDLTGKPAALAWAQRKSDAEISDVIHGTRVRIDQIATRIESLESRNRSVIVPVDSIAYGYLLRDELRVRGVKVEFCHSNPGKDRVAKILKELDSHTASGVSYAARSFVLRSKDRKAMLARVASGETRVLIATSLADEGLDLPILDACVLATPAGGATRIEQQIGRACRPRPGKPQPLVVYVLDSGVSRSETVIDRDTGARVEQVKRPLLNRFKRNYYAVFRKMADVDEVAVRRVLSRGETRDKTQPVHSPQRVA